MNKYQTLIRNINHILNNTIKNSFNIFLKICLLITFCYSPQILNMENEITETVYRKHKKPFWEKNPTNYQAKDALFLDWYDNPNKQEYKNFSEHMIKSLNKNQYPKPEIFNVIFAIAISNDDLELTKKFLENHANPNKNISRYCYKNNKTLSPSFFWATSPEMINLLIKHDAKITTKDINNNNILHHLIKYPTHNDYIKDEKIRHTLFEHYLTKYPRTNLSELNKEGKSLWHILIENVHYYSQPSLETIAKFLCKFNVPSSIEGKCKVLQSVKRVKHVIPMFIPTNKDLKLSHGLHHNIKLKPSGRGITHYTKDKTYRTETMTPLKLINYKVGIIEEKLNNIMDEEYLKKTEYEAINANNKNVEKLLYLKRKINTYPKN